MKYVPFGYRNYLPKGLSMDAKSIWEMLPEDSLTDWLSLCRRERDHLEMRAEEVQQTLEQKRQEIVAIEVEIERRQAARIEREIGQASLAEEGAPLH